jgi:peptide-methionine (S)-S-oxide reductase
MKRILAIAVALSASPAVAANPKLETAVLAGGCFWGVEAVFERVKGVASAVSGYAGGSKATANYSEVSSNRTRHAEAVRISYDPRLVSYSDLLRIFFTVAHDPTELNRQGPDVGLSYRSAIFPQSPAQKLAAERFIAALAASKAYPRPIVTRIETGPFFAAEAYHQDFLRKNPRHPYVLAHDVPKLAALKRKFPAVYRD